MGTWAKVPSEIMYTPKGEVHKWGYQIMPSDERIAWLKLLLQPTEYISAGIPTLAETKDLTTGKKPVTIVADYLSCLRTHFLEHIKDRFGKAFVDIIPIDYTLAVPVVKHTFSYRVQTANRLSKDLEGCCKSFDTRGGKDGRVL